MRSRILAVAIVMTVPGPKAVACTCSFPSVFEAVRKADFVFRGRLTKIDYLDGFRSLWQKMFYDRQIPRRFIATLEVSEVWKGQTGRVIVLHTREGGPDCIGFWTDMGQEYLIFANWVRVRPPDDHFLPIPDWSDKVPAGKQVISPGICTLSEEIGLRTAEKMTAEKMRLLGPSKPPM